VWTSNDILPLQAIRRGARVPENVEDMQNRNFVICTNKTAWMNEDIMLIWIEKISSKFYIISNEIDLEKMFSAIQALLFLDDLKAYKLEVMKPKFAECRTDLIPIPPGLTFFS